MASGASQPGLNVLVLDDRAISAGAVGVSLSGDIDIDFIISQGLPPIGKPLIVTKCKDKSDPRTRRAQAIEALQEVDPVARRSRESACSARACSWAA